MELLAERAEVVTIAQDWEDSRSLDAAAATLEAMRDGTPIIAQAVMRDPEHRTYGMADLLVRSDVLAELFPDDLSEEDAAAPAPQPVAARSPLPRGRYQDAHARPAGRRRRGPVGRHARLPGPGVGLQHRAGAHPGLHAARGLPAGAQLEAARPARRGCLERLGRIDIDNTFDKYDGASLTSLTLQAHELDPRGAPGGAEWEVLPVPTRPELYPHMGNEYDDPWHGAKAAIAAELEELTLLPGVNPLRRRAAHERGMTRWTDSAVSARSLELSGEAARMCDAVLAANRADEPVVLPERLDLDDDSWREVGAAGAVRGLRDGLEPGR